MKCVVCSNLQGPCNPFDKQRTSDKALLQQDESLQSKLVKVRKLQHWLLKLGSTGVLVVKDGQMESLRKLIGWDEKVVGGIIPGHIFERWSTCLSMHSV